jgi:hypothetical protein
MLYPNCSSLCYRICYYNGPGKADGTEIEWDTSASLSYTDVVNLLGDNIERNRESATIER